MKNKYKVMVGNYAVAFTFNEYTSQQSALNAIGVALREAATRTYAGLNGGLDSEMFVTNLIRRAAGADLVNRYDSNVTWVNQLTLTLEAYTYKLYVYSANGYNVLWSGSLNYFEATKHISNVPAFQSYKDKTVRFTYTGGSVPNEKRLVKVTAYEDGCLKGTDLAKGEFRQFKTDKIKDIVEVKL